MTDKNKTLNEQEIKVNTEWDALTKMIFERVMDYDEMSEEKKKIFRQRLDQENWKEFFNFKFENTEEKGWVITYNPHGYFNDMLYKFQQILDFSLNDWTRENKKLTQEIENYRLENEKLKVEVETHLEALETGGKERWTRKEALTKEVEEKTELLQETAEKLKKSKAENQKLKEEGEITLQMLKEVKEREAKKNQKIKELETQLSLLNNKPFSKNPSKFKFFKERAKTKLQNLAEKTKHQGQKLFARIEVRVK